MSAIVPGIILGGLGLGMIFTFLRPKDAKAATRPAALPAAAVAPGAPTYQPIQTVQPVRAPQPVQSTLAQEKLRMGSDLKKQYAAVIQELGLDSSGRMTGPTSKEAVQRATFFESVLQNAGFPEAAKQLRVLIKQASVNIPTPPPSQTVPLPAGVPAWLQEQITRSLALERNPQKLRQLVTALQSLPNANSDSKIRAAVVMLETAIEQIELQQSNSQAMKETEDVLKQPDLIRSPGFVPQTAVYTPPTAPTPSNPIPVPTIPAPQPAPPVKTDVQRAAEAVALHLTSLIRRYTTVTAAKGNEDKMLVKKFQRLAGLKDDGLVGPGTMTAMAKAGAVNLPPVLYWPRFSTAKRVYQYRNDLNNLANTYDARGQRGAANALRVSAANEKGQGGVTGVVN